MHLKETVLLRTQNTCLNRWISNDTNFWPKRLTYLDYSIEMEDYLGDLICVFSGKVKKSVHTSCLTSLECKIIADILAT